MGDLWTFVAENAKSIAYFPVKTDNEALVNEVFRRLNTGGMALTQIELVLGEVKKIDPTYEEQLWRLSRAYFQNKRHQVLQRTATTVFLLGGNGNERNRRIRINRDDVNKFLAALAHQDALLELFEGYLWGLFKINHTSIVPRWLAILPIGVYLTMLKRSGRRWRVRDLTTNQVSAMHTYFLLAQFCDWNTQTMVSAFAKLATAAGSAGEDFPIEAIREIAIQRYRTGVVSIQQFLGLRWFATKVLTPARSYVFHENKPQIDHIFPIGLSEDAAYKKLVDVLWNLQPIPDGINNYKRARHPKEFFNSDDGSKYWEAYDFVPERQSPIWDDPACFIQYREERMRRALLERYGLELADINE